VATVVVATVVVATVVVAPVVVVAVVVPIHNHKKLPGNNMKDRRGQRWNRSDFKTTSSGLSRSHQTGRSTGSTGN
jgi:hypothetical protein